MVRATYTLVLVRMNGNYWTGCDQTSVTAMCTQADYKLDGYTHPDTLGTGNNEKELAVDVVMNMVALDLWGQAGGYLSGFPMPVVMTREIKDIADRLATVSANAGFAAEPMVDES